MKTKLLFPLFAGGIVVCALAGCATADTASTHPNRGDVARMKQQAQNYENEDGSLDPVYLAKLALSGNGRKSNEPLFDQPRGP